ncbi:hypothetical protein ACH4VX_05625 [Streptomyces sp. NPDC020731]|uniref:hypothetical protein n=1 Tax=Streptomyces sp. NPDC020731 TaxID=3365085 RepID=UPI00379985E7
MPALPPTAAEPVGAPPTAPGAVLEHILGERPRPAFVWRGRRAAGGSGDATRVPHTLAGASPAGAHEHTTDGLRAAGRRAGPAVRQEFAALVERASGVAPRRAEEAV